MRKSRFTEEQIIAILREKEAGAATADVCRRHGVNSATFYKWKAKFGGMAAATLARLIDQSEAEAIDLQRRHKSLFLTLWRWSDAVETEAYLTGHLSSVFGWRIDVGIGANSRMLLIFPLLPNGAETLRLACCLATEGGIRVCMPLYDALLIEAPLGQLDDTIRRTQEHMAEASRIMLNGFALRSEVKVSRVPDRWRDSRGTLIRQVVERTLGRLRGD